MPSNSTRKKLDTIRVVVNGAGAAAISCARLYKALGVKKENMIMCDSKGVIYTGRAGLNAEKEEFAVERFGSGNPSVPWQK